MNKRVKKNRRAKITHVGQTIIMPKENEAPRQRAVVLSLPDLGSFMARIVEADRTDDDPDGLVEVLTDKDDRPLYDADYR